MADYLLILLATTGLAAAVRGLVPSLNVRWLAMASVSLAIAALARSVGIILIPILVLCALFGICGPLSRRAAALGAALLPVLESLVFTLGCLSQFTDNISEFVFSRRAVRRLPRIRPARRHKDSVRAKCSCGAARAIRLRMGFEVCAACDL